VRVGLQLYTLRADLAQEFRGTLAAVAGLGYEGVELHDLFGHRVQEVRGWLDELGLAVAGAHASLDRLEGELEAIALELRALGTDRVAISWVDPPEDAAAARASVERIDAVAGRATALGLRVGFHNHWAEVAALDGGETMLEMLRALPPDRLWLELDLGWIWFAGADAVAELQASAGRCPLVHVKDFRSREGRDFCPVGDGSVGYDHVLPATAAAGVEWLLVEQDEVEGPGLAAVERSLAAVRAIVGATA